MADNTKPVLSDTLKLAIYDNLRVMVGASDSMAESFMRNWPACKEFRVPGALGFGGKVWFEKVAGSRYRVYVNCYPEDRTPERDELIARVNERLSSLLLNDALDALIRG